MVYLFETEHFLIREKTSENIRLPNPFPEESTAFRRFLPVSSLSKNLPEALIAESRTTGMPVGEITIRAAANPDRAYVFCRLYEKFQQSGFVKEITDAIKVF